MPRVKPSCNRTPYIRGSPYSPRTKGPIRLVMGTKRLADGDVQDGAQGLRRFSPPVPSALSRGEGVPRTARIFSSPADGNKSKLEKTTEESIGPDSDSETESSSIVEETPFCSDISGENQLEELFLPTQATREERREESYKSQVNSDLSAFGTEENSRISTELVLDDGSQIHPRKSAYNLRERRNKNSLPEVSPVEMNNDMSGSRSFSDSDGSQNHPRKSAYNLRERRNKNSLPEVSPVEMNNDMSGSRSFSDSDGSQIHPMKSAYNLCERRNKNSLPEVSPVEMNNNDVSQIHPRKSAYYQPVRGNKRSVRPEVSQVEMNKDMSRPCSFSDNYFSQIHQRKSAYYQWVRENKRSFLPEVSQVEMNNDMSGSRSFSDNYLLHLDCFSISRESKLHKLKLIDPTSILQPGIIMERSLPEETIRVIKVSAPFREYVDRITAPVNSSTQMRGPLFRVIKVSAPFREYVDRITAPVNSSTQTHGSLLRKLQKHLVPDTFLVPEESLPEEMDRSH